MRRDIYVNDAKIEIDTKFSPITSVEDKPKKAPNIILLLVFGIVIGFINGFWGGGGGMICVPVLSLLFKLPEKQAHATTILIMLPLCVASFVVYILKGSIDLHITGIIVAGFVIGGFLGALLLKQVNNNVLKLIFALIIIASGIRMII